jgi:Protein of unknown function (DUF2975)
MKHAKSDPLLTAAKAVLILIGILFIFVAVILIIGLGAILTVERGSLLEQIAEFDAPVSLYWLVVGAFALLIGIFAALLRFLHLLMQMIKSVEAGDPFVPANADRLHQMGWLTLGVQAALLVLWGFDKLVLKYVDNTGLDFSFSLTGWFLALVLFILARVFRHGTNLRAELEGTV